MKNVIIFLMSLALLLPSDSFSQDKRAIRAAEFSFKSAEKDYNNEEYKEAAEKYTITVNTIPAGIESRKHLEIRLDALIKLIDIYFYRYVNITNACEFLADYNSTISAARNSGILKSATLLKYLKQQQEYANKETKQCERYERVGGDMDKFRSNTFEKVFEEEM
ncbi:MAG TPA: hypothetical protein VFC87_03905 [Perlabentimonas sp.]|nr:hypothetical protein [Perlabentimonas sp.]